MITSKIAFLLPAACTLLALSACSKNDNATATTSTTTSASDSPAKTAAATKTTKNASGGSSAIVGTWQDNDGAETITYKADGTMSEKLASGDVVSGTYSMPDAGHLKVKFEGAMAAMGEQTFPVTIAGDGMDMTGPTGMAVHYKKTK